MCGFILAIGNVSKEEVFIATNQIKHRGPDATNYYFDEERKIYMGQNRLSILDDKYGSQPFFSEDKKKILLFNGEIYNHKEIRDDLITKGIKFFSNNSDTETLLKGYQFYGTKIFDYLDGQFACVITDLDKNKIILGRDKFGEKPLFYHVGRDIITVCSELSVFNKIKKINLELSELSLQKYFIYSFVPAPNTIYQNINKLECSHFCVIDIKSKLLQKSRYFNFENFNYSQSKYSYKENIEQLDFLLNNSVKSRLISDKKVGVLLSGGIDSTLISYYAKKYNPNIDSFSISIKKKSFDEGVKSKEIAEYLKIKSNLVNFDQDDFKKNYDNIIRRLDEPIGAPTYLPLYVLSKEASKCCKTVLCGDGGDEIFGGYDLFKYIKLFKTLNLIFNNKTSGIFKSIIKKIPISEKNLSLDFKFRRFLQGMSEKSDYRNTMFLSPVSLEDLCSIFEKKINEEEVFEDLLQFNKKYKNLSIYDKTILYYLNFYLPDLVCSRADKAGMYNSLEIRSPFLNQQIVKFALNLPINQKHSFFETKKILRDLLKTKIDHKYIDRGKLGFTFPLQSWLDIENKKTPLEDKYNFITKMRIMHINKKKEFRNFFHNLNVINNFK